MTAGKDVLLEIGVEELPARFVPAALEGLRENAVKLFEEAGLPVGAPEAYGTPRRLAIFVSNVAPKAADRTEEALGPAVAQAKDAEGNWTPAAQGFARSQGTTPEKLEVRKTDKGDRLCFVKRHVGRPAPDLLPELFTTLLRRLNFPKNMVWEESRFAFARPIRWIAALYGNKAVKLSIAGVKSGANTFGLRTHGTKPLAIPSPAKYVSFLKNQCVVVDPAERRKGIEKQIAQAVKALHGHAPIENYGALLEEVVHLVEHPVAIVGKFDAGYLSLPPEILITSMKKHQKFFPVLAGEKGGKLLAHFVGVRNGISENQGVVREGYERVLAARLSDAAFFVEQDKKSRLEEKAALLKGVLFQKELGMMSDKVVRIEAMCVRLSDKLGWGEEPKEQSRRIAHLAKADLVTQVVGEFPELQGVMGRIYAKAEGESTDVADGIEQHYWPLTADGELPKSDPAALVSVADKLDTLAGQFLVGHIPSGSQDPYGLRRAAMGVLRVISEKGWRLSLPQLVEYAVTGYMDEQKADAPKAKSALFDFFKQRWTSWMESRGFRFDEVQAVVTAGFDDVVNAERRLASLQKVRRHPDFEPMAAAFKRAANILTQARQKNLLADGARVSPDVLKDPAERALYETFQKVEREALARLGEQKYDETLQSFVHLRPDVDRFFDNVMVMAPEQDVRANRLALLSGIAGLFHRVADFSLLQDVPAK